jgi:hypothetical protein
MNNNQESITRMIYNSQDMSDKDFTTNISYIVEEYIHDDIPKQYTYNTLQQAVIQAYKLYITDKLHSFGIYDKRNKTYQLTDALNYFTDINYIKVLAENARLQAELNQYKEFIKQYHVEKTFKDFQQNNKTN